MKRQFVDRLQEGDVINDYFVATRKDLRDTQRGSKFLGMAFKDKTGEIGGVLWNNASSTAQLFEIGDIVNLRGTVNTYQNRLQVRVDQVVPLKPDEYDLDDLRESSDEGKKFLADLAETMRGIEHVWLSKLVNAFLDDDAFMSQLGECSAGKRWHHPEPGGLARHCWEMAQLAETMCQLYPNIHRDLLLTGVFVHDIGKIEEMSHGMVVDYTTPGKLLGHIEQGARMANQRMDAIEGFPEELRQQVVHLILSHHGERDLGSPVVPKTLEAIVLSFIDNLDAQTDAFTRVIEQTRGSGQEWSDWINMIERNIWAGRIPD